MARIMMNGKPYDSEKAFKEFQQVAKVCAKHNYDREIKRLIRKEFRKPNLILSDTPFLGESPVMGRLVNLPKRIRLYSARID